MPADTAPEATAVAPNPATGPAGLVGLPAQVGIPKPDPILVADAIVRRFGGVTAVNVEHVEFQRGAITALIGPNGAGKTTFFNLLTCFDQPQEGEWSFNGQPLKGVAPHVVARRGLVRTFQLTKVLTKLTVIENMRLGATGQKGEKFLFSLLKGFWRTQEDENTVRADDLLARFKMDHMREQFAGQLSGGQRKLLEMARALMTEPELIMLDEPMAGVNPALKQSLLEHVKSLRDEGRSVIFVEHDMDMVFDISDWVVVMAEGRIIAEGTPEQVGQNQAVIDAYLGSHHDSELDVIIHGDVPDHEVPVLTDDLDTEGEHG
jgi:branched-chain amino acid transport system ATP-binding protein